MEHLLKVNIVTPERLLYAGAIRSIIAPGVAGYLEILAHHAPLVTALTRGVLKLQEKTGKRITIRTHGTGFLEVIDNQASVLLESADIAS